MRPRWRDAEPEEFAAAVMASAEQLGVLPLAVEKDFWACEVLRAIVQSHPGEIVFKGGTSLEKLRIVRRFSEDLDLLVVGDYPSHRATQRALKQMLETAARATGGARSAGRSGGGSGSFHRSAYVSPPMVHTEEPGALADAVAILVELGQSGGPHPHRPRSVTSMLSRQLEAVGFATSAWSDLATFDVEVLHPGRTLLEKLFRVNNFASQPDVGDRAHGWARIGRQFYDIWALLGTPEVIDFLQDTALVGDTLLSCYETSRAFTPDLPPPAGGFAASLAFITDGPLNTRLRAEHEAAMDGLYYGTDEPPSFDDVLDRVHEHHALLNPEAGS